MGAGAWILALVNASAASVLLTAGLAKHVTPQPVQRALNEVAGTAVWPGLLRSFATAEIAVAVALSVPALRAPAVVGVVGLGLCFAVVGVRGQLSRSVAPCGCFGSSSRRPLGWANVVVGAALIGVWPVNTALAPSGDYTAGTVLLTAIGSLALCMFINRRLIMRLLRPASPATAGR
jgi:hypothetical protein